MSRMPKVGEVIDDVFRVELELDSGNFGSVYRVRDLLEDRTLALKVLRPGGHDEDELRKRFEREARLIYSLKHPNVVEVYYYGETPTGLPYLAMEYLQGMELRSLMREHGALEPALAKRIAKDTLSALTAAHDLGIVHRDLKPANIFLVDDGDKGLVKVLDFGFAKAFDDESDGAELTNAQTLVGTPAYMAPELVHKKNVGPAADLYAMGLILAEMLTGEKVIDIDNVYDTILFQASGKPIKLDGALKKGPFGVLLKRSVHKSLKKRYTNAAAFLDDLGKIQVEEGPGLDRAPHVTEGIVTRREIPALSASREFGNADMEMATNPRSMGMPSMEEVDRDLGLVASSEPDFGAPAASSDGGWSGPSGWGGERVRTHEPEVTPQYDSRPSGPMLGGQVAPADHSRDSQFYIGGVTSNRGYDTEENPVYRPPHEHQVTERGGVGVFEIALGLGLGAAIVVVALLVLTYAY